MSPATPQPSSPRSTAAYLSRSSRGGDPEPFSARAVVDAAGSGIVAAMLGWFVTFVPVALAWALAAPRRTGFGQAAAVSVDLWALAHRGSLAADGLVVTFAPLLLTLVYVLLFARTTSWLAGTGGAAGRWLADRWWEPALAAAGYVITGALLVILGNLGSARILWWSVLPGLVVVPLLGMVPFGRPAVRGFPWARQVRDRWLATPWLAEATRPAAWGTAAALGAGAVVVLVSVVAGFQRVAALHRALGADTTGGIVLTLGQLLSLPNLAVWGLAWTTGATLHVGEADVNLVEAHGGTLPLVPVLGVLPEGGAMPWLVWLALLVPLGVGVLVGMLLPRETILARVVDSLVPALLASILVGAAMTGATWLATAGVAPGALTQVGAAPLVAGSLLAFQVAVGATVTTLMRRGFVGWRG